MGITEKSTGQFGVKHFKADGTGVLNETLTPNPGVDWRILSIKLHVKAAPVATEDFVIQVKDPSQNRHNAVLIREDMAGTDDVVQHYEGSGITFLKGQLVDFDWANTDGNEWGLIVSYSED